MDLIGSKDAAAIGGITPSTFRDLVRKGDAVKDPVPPAVVQGSQGTTTLWDRGDIEAWAVRRDRKRGRRAAE